MSNILKTEATQTKLSAAQTSTNEAQTNKAIRGEFGACGGGLSDLRMTINILYLTNQSSTNNFFTAQTSTNEHKRMRLFLQHFALGGGPTSRRSF